MSEIKNSSFDGLDGINFKKYSHGLVPVIIQDASTYIILMLGFMNEEALTKTIETKLVTFYSRSKRRLWTKGEISKNYLHLVDIKTDCDNDTVLIKANPDGPVCHTGADTCFNERILIRTFSLTWKKLFNQEKEEGLENSYVSSLFKKGINKIAQKMGEEAIELVIEAKDNDDDKFKNEAADLIFHYLVLLNVKGFSLDNIVEVLKERHLK